jgi:hypothetical protein
MHEHINSEQNNFLKISNQIKYQLCQFNQLEAISERVAILDILKSLLAELHTYVYL